MGNTGKYTYLSWIRKGMASEIQEVDKLGRTVTKAYDNASVSININVKSGSDKVGSDTQEFALLGPGDVNVKAIASSEAHTEPIRGLRNVEYNNLPYIQFYDEDFPWRFSPAKNNNGKLRPWLQLIALTEDEFSSNGINSKNYVQIQINSGVPVPNHEESWMWSHVQIDLSLADYAKSFKNKAEAIQNLMTEEPNSITSRILCPRKLEPNTHYFLFLIPAFERGRLAGLDQDISTAGIQDYALQETVTSKVYDFPTYHAWDFRTSDGGDFEELAVKLKKVESDALENNDREIGSKTFSTLDIGDGIHYSGTAFGEKGGMKLFGALTQPSANPKSIIHSTNQPVRKFTYKLKNYLNTPLSKVDDKTATVAFSDEIDNLEDDPIISAPIYGAWHSQNFSVDEKKKTNWQNEINLDPGNRIVAGLGAELFRENQDALMKTAWDQYGEIREANRKINQASFLEMTNKKLHNKYLKHATSERLIGTTSLLHGRIQFGSSSVKSHLETASIPTSSFTKAFQNSARNGSSLMKSMTARNTAISKSELSSKVIRSQVKLPTKMTLSSSSFVASKTQINASIDKALKSATTLAKFNIDPSASKIGKRNEQTKIKSALRGLKTKIGTKATQSKAPIPKFSTLSRTISTALLPQKTLLSKLNGVISLSEGSLKKMEPVMAYPKITIPIHSLLLDKHMELFIPQLDLLEDNSVTLLSANQNYIESLMLGFNSEMARELVWRDYPTDQRGSYARIFWESIKMKNDTGLSLEETANKYGHVKEIHKWNGSHGSNPNPTNDLSDMVVVVLRGELLQKYPNTLIYFQEAKWENARTKKVRELNDSKAPLLPEFSAKLTSDIHILGFDISAEQARGKIDKLGSFLVMQEPPAENKFGMDISSTKYESWNDLAWDQFKEGTEYIQISDLKKTTKKFDGVTWGANSNHMAYILNQRPFKLAVHAEKLI